MGEEKLINSKFITNNFGSNSEIFKEFIRFLKSIRISDSNYENNFRKWLKFFDPIYGKKISSELFLKHSYFAFILKILVYSKLGSMKNHDFEEIYRSNYGIELLNYKLFEFDFFFWTSIKKGLIRKIYNKIKGVKFAKEDLFSQLYQEIFISDIRHKRGEFFTPLRLVTKMVDDFYDFGSKVLDPSSGSGNFLVKIIIRILDSQKPHQIKMKAISNVYGFDINPLAVMTAKTNIFLLLVEKFGTNEIDFPKINVYFCDSLFSEDYDDIKDLYFNDLYNSFDLIIGNPPWLTYKDLHNKAYQNKIRVISDKLNIKPSSQYITHIELAAVFFYAIPLKFLKESTGRIFFVMPRSVLNGDHCHKFRAFSIFGENLEIWDFPNNYFFNVEHICLKARFIGQNKTVSINDHYPIKVKIFNEKLVLKEVTEYSTLKVEKDGAKLILSNKELRFFDSMESSRYKKKFFQGATIVPRSLVFFQIKEKKNGFLIIESDPDILSRTKKNWEYRFENKEIEEEFHFLTFLNIDLIPFLIKNIRNIFLPTKRQLIYDPEFIHQYKKASDFYNEINSYYKEHKKETSKISNLFNNLNYWNKLQKQYQNKSYIVVYNASGSNLKAAVIYNEEQKIIVGSENYYYSTNLEEEAYYLAAILNSPNLSKKIKLIKSSRHIHKRPFLFPIPIYDKKNPIHKTLAKKGKRAKVVVEEILGNNPKITSKKVRTIINRKLMKIQELIDQIIFQKANEIK
ncbi:MAG: class I SAM-dependent DNA methyltransferase [Candidatus Thorarchaeota archaeon]